MDHVLSSCRLCSWFVLWWRVVKVIVTKIQIEVEVNVEGSLY